MTIQSPLAWLAPIALARAGGCGSPPESSVENGDALGALVALVIDSARDAPAIAEFGVY